MNPDERSCHHLQGPDCRYYMYNGLDTECCALGIFGWRGTLRPGTATCRCYLPVPLPRDYSRFTRRVLAAYCICVASVVTIVFGILVILRLVTFLTTL